MRVSRLVSKERLREVIDEALEELEKTPSFQCSAEVEIDTIADAVWSLLGELDSVDDFSEPDQSGMFTDGLIHLGEEDADDDA